MYSNYYLSFFEGIMTFISPCILPMLPIYFLYLAGMSDEGQGQKKHKKSTLILNSIGFVAGFTIIFVLLGATATSIGAFLKSHMDILKIISGILIIIFGLNFMGLIKIGFLNTEKRFDFHFERLNFIKSIVFGIVFSLGWTPCIGPFLGSLLTLASMSETLFEGMLLLFIYSLGLGLPFIISAAIFENLKGAFKAIQRHSRIISTISGILLIAVGVALIFNFI